MIEPTVFLTPKPSTGPFTRHCCLSQYVGWVKQPFHKTGKRESLALTVYMFKHKTSKQTSECGKAGGSAVQGTQQACCCSPLNVLVLPQGGRLSLGHAFNEIHQLFHEKPEFKQKKKGMNTPKEIRKHWTLNTVRNSLSAFSLSTIFLSAAYKLGHHLT